MDLKMLSYIIAVSEEKTISQAARSLFISQPALSQSIKKAEDELGVKLFTRMGNTLALTSSGEVVVQEGRKLLQGREYLLTRLARLAEKHREVLRFGVSPFYSKYYLPGVYTYYARHLPDIKLEIIEKISVELEEDVVRGDLDFCFVPAYPARPELTYRTVSIEEILLGVPPTPTPFPPPACPTSTCPACETSRSSCSRPNRRSPRCSAASFITSALRPTSCTRPSTGTRCIRSSAAGWVWAFCPKSYWKRRCCAFTPTCTA